MEVSKISNKRRSRTASMGRIKDRSNIQQITFTKMPIINKNVSTEASAAEFKPVALENYEFENRQNTISDWTFPHVRPINIPL